MSWPTRRSPKRPSDYSPDSANTGIVRRGPQGVLLPRCGLLPRGVRENGSVSTREGHARRRYENR